MTFTPVIEKLNLWSAHLAPLVWPLFWQSAVLMAGMFLCDLFLRRKLRPSVRHALWLVVLVKLLLPPSFALPSGIGWWLRPREAAPARPTASYVVTYGSFHEPRSSQREEAPSSLLPVLPSVRLSTPARASLASVAISATLMIIMLVRWRCLRLQLRESQPAPIWLQEIVCDARRMVRRRRSVRLMLTDAAISPALCGLFRPVIVLPATLVKQLKPDQLRAVLLHELFHLRNGDVWINCFQSLLQIVFWWHPPLWIANARIRRIREEVVDDAVRLALGEEAEGYAPTLLEVARLSLARPLATLGLVGILESRHALRQRVERMVNVPIPKRAGLTLGSIIGILAFTSIAVPMGQAPPKPVKITIDDKPTLYYTFDQNFVDYFGSNGVDAVRQALARWNADSKFERYTADSSRFDSPKPIPESDQATSEFKNSSAMADSAWQIQPLGESGQIDFDVRSGTITASNGAVVTRADATLSADNITANRDTGEIVAEGTARLQRGSKETRSSRISINVTNLQFAQAQPSAVAPARIYTSKGRSTVFNKLQALRLDKVTFDNLPLSEVVNYLRDEAKKRDPQGKGINFLLMPNSDAPAPTIDPATGSPVPTPQTEPVDINSVAIRITPSLEDVRLLDVLDAIVKVADKRIRYSIEDYGVSFRLAGNETPVPLFTRTIRVDPNVFAQGLESVVGVSVGNFQTGGQGGGGGQQGSGGGVTIPRVQVAPNGIGGQGGQGGVQGGGGGISGVTRPTAMASPQAINQFFANSGINLSPPKSVFFNDRAGTLLVHASLSDLDAIESAVGALSADSAQPVSVANRDSASIAVSTQTNGAQVPFLGNLPIVGSLYQISSNKVTPANSPKEVADSGNSNKADKLLTRVFRIDPRTFIESVRSVVAFPDHPSSQDAIYAFRKMLLDSGVELVPPKNLFYNEHGATLLVRATAQEMDVIEKFVQAFNTSPPQINIKAKFVEVAENDAKSLSFNWLSNSPPAGSFSSNFASALTLNADTNSSAAILTDPQFRVVLHALEQRDGVDLLSENSVTTLSGRQAQVQNADIQSIVQLNPEALNPPGVTSSNVFKAVPFSSGPCLDISPFAESGADRIQLSITVKVSEFLGYEAPENVESVPVYLDGKDTTIKPPHPRIHVRTMQSNVDLYDGQTIMLGKPTDELITYDPNGNAVSTPTTSKKNLLVFITATLIDPAGNPIHTAAAPATIPVSK